MPTTRGGLDVALCPTASTLRAVNGAYAVLLCALYSLEHMSLSGNADEIHRSKETSRDPNQSRFANVAPIKLRSALTKPT